MKYGSILILLSMSLVLYTCKGEDEESQKYSPLLGLFNINVIQGVVYNGNSFISECKDSPLLQKCILLKESESQIYRHINDNTRMILWIDNNVINANVRLALAHFDLSVHDFEFRVTGSSKDELSGKKVLTANPVDNIASRTNSDYTISLRRLQLEMDNTIMIGAMDLHLKKKNEEGFADVTFTVHVRKEL